MYTVVITETERARWTANQINKAIRHCKIGKVVEKRQANGGKWDLPKSWMPDPIKPFSKPFFSGGYVRTTRSGDVPFVLVTP